MKLKHLFGTSSREDDRGVSPVIGVALLIAITVTLVAVIGAVVMGIGPTTSAPDAKMDFTTSVNDSANSTYDVVLSHDGGDALAANQITVLVGNSNHSLTSDLSGSDFTAGDRTTVATDVSEGTRIALVWHDQNSDKSRVLAEMTVE